ncbi:hypothetical protein ACVMGC_003708 [Bradyrhizobium barranii subsp. barranii]|uniref:Uncharacterized protein n=1 Tax=Bradyrhizobium barranii subsp. barranii TaxID=2823807 RepID=A0A939MLW2_9BRAD|nr:hypothetical protein [Bradyrhizobium barranii]UEM11910.1 hypothetical protein J4G43_046965 [Bradyrhizobium barranii subsp. barranii]
MSSDEEQAERDADIGRDAANVLLALINGVSPGVAYNIIGCMTVTVFTTVPFVNPLDALDEFDQWAAYTRQMIASEIKERLQ